MGWSSAYVLKVLPLQGEVAPKGSEGAPRSQAPPFRGLLPAPMGTPSHQPDDFR